ncbi:hypothetical protein BCR35DRAFT_307895 [Leucosporidium creatinivorum]|uniref:F-box domain-containing protein n=1 Tax=Leucosporidium creatinivorum TaxID=106004 RepID=A0A1Y2EGA5_9BASI|nr:hypothetical protein BCR35DRAFT_307895 [Leucosporidium creatinivorum]
MQALPALLRLDLDAWLYSFDCDSTDPNAGSAFYLPAVAGISPHAPLPHPHIISHLKDLRLRFNIADVDLYALLASSGSTLEHLDLYTEHVLPPNLLCVAFSSSLNTLRSLKWTTNPPLDVRSKIDELPTFDRLLPHFVKLESLIISATDVSWNLLALLPPSLQHLEVQAFTYQTPFRYSDAMIETLADHSRPFHLETLIVRDSGDVWSAEQVFLLGLACAARDITFTFIADEDVSEYGLEFDGA